MKNVYKFLLLLFKKVMCLFVSFNGSYIEENLHLRIVKILFAKISYTFVVICCTCFDMLYY